MQQVTGRLTADATITELEGGKKVVNFNIADNQYYHEKERNERVKVATFFTCSYWLGTSITKVLRKGATVQVTGRVKPRAYLNKKGELVAALNFHTSHVQVLGYAADESTAKSKSRKSKN